MRCERRAWRRPRRVVEEALAEDGPPLAVLRRLVEGLVEVAAERRLEALPAEPVADAALPAVRRLLGAVEMTPELPAAWLRKATSHFVDACFRAGVDSAARPRIGRGRAVPLTHRPARPGPGGPRPGRTLSQCEPARRADAHHNRPARGGQDTPGDGRRTALRGRLAGTGRRPSPGGDRPHRRAAARGARTAQQGRRDAWTLADARALAGAATTGLYGFLSILSTSAPSRSGSSRACGHPASSSRQPSPARPGAHPGRDSSPPLPGAVRGRGPPN